MKPPRSLRPRPTDSPSGLSACWSTMSPRGLPAGDVARALDIPQNTSSTHLAILVNAGTGPRRAQWPLDHLSSQPRPFSRADPVPAQGLLQRPHGGLRAADRRTDAVLRPRRIKLRAIDPHRSKHPSPDFNASRNSVHDRSHLQCPVSLHRQLRPLDPRRSASWPRTARGRFRAFSAGSMPKGESIRWPSKRCTVSAIRPRGCARRAGTNSTARMRRPWISSLPSATTPRAKSARSGPAIRRPHIGASRIRPRSKARRSNSKQAFATAFRHLKNRISTFIALPFERLDRAALVPQLHEIGRQEGQHCQANTLSAPMSTGQPMPAPVSASLNAT